MSMNIRKGVDIINDVKHISLLLLLVLAAFILTGCSEKQVVEPVSFIPQEEEESEGPRYIVTIDDEPDTVDFQCTTINYTIAQNVFNRLVESETDGNDRILIMPSLAESWEISDDRCRYTFHLRKNVTFSNGQPLTASDVLYTMVRMMTNPDTCNRDILRMIKGAGDLEEGKTESLAGFEILGDLDFAITLEEPFEAFLACLSMPGASILDEETSRAAGDRFGKDPAYTIGTGSFIFTSWEPGKGILLTANRDCWAGPPACDGVDLRFMSDSETARMMFENGELDILDLDELDNSAEFFIHGDIYRDRIHTVRQIGITYIALNESMEPLGDVRVRQALQRGLNRTVLLDAGYSGRGSVENGIFPHGLYGFNPYLPEIPYDPEGARELLCEAGYPDGLDLTISVKASSTQLSMRLMDLVSFMWERIGVRAHVSIIDENEFMQLRKTGGLTCYCATWTADYNDPDNFIHTFFGSYENTVFRSLCYPDTAVMERVCKARKIADAEERLAQYRDLEQKIIQEDAAWIPLFSRERYYVTSERLRGFRASWNGSVKNNYREMSIEEMQ